MQENISLDDKNIKAVEKALGNPITGEFPENTLKIRRNLLVMSMISIAIVLGGLQINPASTFFGVAFSGLTDKLIKLWLALITLYLFAHFLWCSFDNFMEWRIRVTGTKLAFITVARAAGEHQDYPNDPKQSSLYCWWINEAPKIGNMKSRLLEMEGKLGKWEEDLQATIKSGADGASINNACNSINMLKADIRALKDSIDSAQKVLFSARVPGSLKRFDSWFQLFLRSQNLRWFIIELMLPIVAGVIALLLLGKTFI